MDQLYFLDGYYEGNYFVYTADVIVGFTPYIAEGYLDQGFFEDRGGAFTLTGSLTRLEFLEFNAGLTSAFVLTGAVGKLQITTASMSSAFTVTVTVVKTVSIQKALTSTVTVATVSQKTARSSVTLSSIADLAAQAARFRGITSSVTATATVSATVIKTTQTSPALESQSTFTASAARTRSTPATLSAVTTQTSTTQKTARATIGLTSAFAPVITAVASVSNGSNFTTNFALTALTGVRRQFPLNQLTGLGATSNQTGRIEFNQSLFPPPVSGNTFTVRTNQWTFSAWVKRDSITGEFQCIAEGTVQSDSGGSSINNGGITLKNNNVRIRTNYDPDEPGGEWSGVAPTDTAWHHYLFRSHVPEAGLVRRWKLWINGIYQGLSSGNFSAGDLQFAGRYGSQQGTLYGGLRLGNGSIAQDTGGYSIVAAPLLGGVAQVWMGTTTDDQFRVDRFYSGLLDMGANGTSTGLPTPVFYNKLTTPFTGVTLSSGSPPIESASAPLSLPSAQGQFSVVVESVTVLEVTVNAQSTSTLTVTAQRNRLATAAITSTATFTVNGSKIVGVNSQLTTTASTTVISQRVRYADSALASAVSVTSTAFRVKQFGLALNSLATQTVTAFRTKPLAATLASQFTVSAQIDDRTRSIIALEIGAFTLTASVGRTRTASTSVSVSTSLSIVYQVIRPAGSAMSVAFTQTATPEKRIIAFGNFTAPFTIVSTVFRVLIGQANLSVQGFTLTQGDILNFDPCREIRVDPETRLARILPESRLLIVESETRGLKVPQETRVLKVDYETRVNTIKC